MLQIFKKWFFEVDQKVIPAFLPRAALLTADREKASSLNINVIHWVTLSFTETIVSNFSLRPKSEI